jgi:hypothetical protein
MQFSFFSATWHELQPFYNSTYNPTCFLFSLPLTQLPDDPSLFQKIELSI